ncbi:MAG: NlpC/P60 family protein [Bacillaceae bacterium]
MLKKVTISLLTSAVVLTPLVQTVSADRISDKISAQKSVLETKQSELTSVKNDINKLEETIKKLDAEVKTAEKKLKATQENIKQTKEEIKEKKEKIAYLQVKVEKREELLKERLVAMQEQPKVSVLAKVILGSDSIINMIERLSAVNKLFEADNQIMTKQKEEQDLLGKEEAALKSKENALVELEDTQKKDQQALLDKKEEQKKTLNQAQEKMAVLVSEINAESADLAELERQALFIQQQVEENEIGQVSQTPDIPAASSPNKPDKPNKPSNPNSSKPVQGNGDVVSFGLQFIGVPYVFGGASPSGFDCSGFIYYVYKNNGYGIGRASVGSYWSQVTKVSNPVPGDLVFLQNTYKAGPSHIGIYIGNGQMVHAGPNGIAVASLSSSYNQKHFLGYGRF